MTERVVIVGAETYENEQNFAASLEELTNLVETAGGKVVAELTQKREALNSKTVIGKGKLEELARIADSEEAALIVFNQELSPRQTRNLEESVQLRVIDRVQLILDIFALRARSKEGKLQVELAQLNYLLPRLTGQGQSLSRLGAGIGTRGPGETKLETDRRHIRGRISSVKKELELLSAHRERSREKRKKNDVFRIGLIGYTNAGKSTLLNLLTDAAAYSEDQLFATLDPLTRRLILPSQIEVTLTDTVGFIQDIPHQLVEAFHSTLEESREMDLLLHVVDASADNRLQQEETVLKLMKELDFANIPVLTIYNKIDRVALSAFTPTLFPNVQIAATQKRDQLPVLAAIENQMKRMFTSFQIEVPLEKSYEIAQMKKEIFIDKEHLAEEDGVYIVTGYAAAQSKWLYRYKNQLNQH